MSFDKNYFTSNTYKNTSFARFSQYWWSNHFYANLARRYGKHGVRLLEIGSGLGHLVGQLENTFKTVAVDVNFWALKQSSRNIRSTFAIASSAQDLPFPSGIFGVVIIKHVVEHLVDPGRAISEIGRVVAKDGIVLLSTPNLKSLLKPLKGEKWIGYQDPTHISLKTPQEWISLISKAGFEVQQVFTDGFWDVPYIPIIPYIIQKLFFGSLGGIQAITSIPFLPGRWGESIIVIARKSSTD
jgi:ubiquinone/menaquinone biosynthesis C-methylase UbiE